MENIFNEIVHIMNNDYAGWRDKKGCDNPETFIQKIRLLQNENQLSKEVFKKLVDDYLLDYNDSHIYFLSTSSQNKKLKVRGFQVRRFDDRLYVTHVDSENQLKPGMYFVSLGGYSVADLKERHHRLLNENHTERENWTSILSLYDVGEVVSNDGTRREISFGFYDKKAYTPTYSIQELSGNIVLITMTDFADPDAIAKMITDHKGILEASNKWIFDVRVNNGGSDSSYYPFLPYIMPEEGVELADKEDKMFFNCTEENANRILEELEEQLENTDDEQARLFLEIFQQQWGINAGKGFVEFDFTALISDTFIKGNKHPESIVVITDNKCGSSGDSFVEIVKKSKKVTVIGRATLGLNDYANLASQKWDEGFELMYPTSRLSRIDKGQGMTGVGIEPHIHIPWTPEHIVVDIDMKTALNIVSSFSSSSNYR